MADVKAEKLEKVGGGEKTFGGRKDDDSNHDNDDDDDFLFLVSKTKIMIIKNFTFQASLFFINVFISSVVVLSGFDCFLQNGGNSIFHNLKMLEKFPQSLQKLLNYSKWVTLSPKVRITKINLFSNYIC